MVAGKKSKSNMKKRLPAHSNISLRLRFTGTLIILLGVSTFYLTRYPFPVHAAHMSRQARQAKAGAHGLDASPAVRPLSLRIRRAYAITDSLLNPFTNVTVTSLA